MQGSRKKQGLEGQGEQIRVRRKGLLEKGSKSFQKGQLSRDSREFRDSSDRREPPDCGRQKRIRPFSRDSRESREVRDSRDSSSEKTPFAIMTRFFRPRQSEQIGGNPDPPIFLFFFSPCFFFVFRFSLLFLGVCLAFPRILGVPRREKPLPFSGFPLFFFFFFLKN